MKARFKRAAAAAALGTSVLAGCSLPSSVLERVADNRYEPPSAPIHCEGRKVCDEADALYIADLHADTLLWTRELSDLLPEHRGHGHVSLELLREGRTDLQVFAAPTITPLHEGYTDPVTGEPGVCIPSDGLDLQVPLRLFGGAARYPATVLSPRARALRQAARLEEWIAEPGSRLRRVRTVPDLDAAEAQGEIGALFALEGMHWVGGDETAVRAELAELARIGVRMASLTHRFANGLAVGSEDCGLLRDPSRQDAGLSAAGRWALDEMMARGIIVDVAHASPASIAQITELVRARRAAAGTGAAGRIPGLLHSHGGVQAVCPLPRNLDRASIQAILDAGGVVGIGYWPEALCSRTGDLPEVALRFAASLVAVIEAARDPAFLGRRAQAGAAPIDPFAHIALGSDFDGAVRLKMDAGDQPALLQALAEMDCATLKAVDPRLADVCAATSPPALPLTPERLKALAGANARRVLAAALPR
ncbi:dipeptidase [Rhodovulum sp. DZ06]|uniref:dipeptidase n=1 Tax=Rhodovulum sp. DZ06 TaxID=3425126 RepID=UPI003D33705F